MNFDRDCNEMQVRGKGNRVRFKISFILFPTLFWAQVSFWIFIFLSIRLVHIVPFSYFLYSICAYLCSNKDLKSNSQDVNSSSPGWNNPEGFSCENQGRSGSPTAARRGNGPSRPARRPNCGWCSVAKCETSQCFINSTVTKTTLLDIRWQEEIYFVNVLAEIPLVQKLKHFLQMKRQRQESRVSAVQWRYSDTGWRYSNGSRPVGGGCGSWVWDFDLDDE